MVVSRRGAPPKAPRGVSESPHPHRVLIGDCIAGMAKLPAASVDLVLMVDVYHEFSEPQKMLRKIRQALKPDGRLVLLEYRKEDPKIPIRLEHKMSIAEVKAEIEPEGYRLEKTLETLPRQHILIFTKSREN